MNKKLFNRSQELFLWLITGKYKEQKYFTRYQKSKIDLLLSLWNPPVICEPVNKKNTKFVYKLFIDYEIEKPNGLEEEIIQTFLDMIS